jgi:hypothetical protein
MFMPLGVVVRLFIKQANQSEATSTPFSLLSTSKEGGQKNGPRYPNYILPAGHRHHEDFKV